MDVKQLMIEYFQRPEINKKILAYVDEHKLRYQSLTNDELMNILDELHILDPLLDEIQSAGNQQKGVSVEQDMLEDVSIPTALKNIKIWIEKGRKFKQWASNSQGDKFFISLSAFGQKFRTNSRPVSQNFTLGEQFTFTAQNRQLKTNNNQMIELAVVLQTKSGSRKIFSIKLIEWRYILAHGSVNFDVILAPYYHEGVGEMPAVGVLSVKLQLTPLSKLNMVQPITVDREIELEMKNKQKYNNQFYTYANLFWNEYKQIHKAFQSRRIKIYGNSDDKIFIPLCRFVCPLYNVRGIDSPQHALRFCSLIPFQQEAMNKQASHKRFHNMIVGMQGTIDDHCHLLCSLLLGFGLKAYVCIGFSYRGEHSWVISEDTKNSSITFWQCTKGTKYDFYSPKIYDIYKTIHTVYNHNQFYANIQLDDSIAGTKYKFKDNTLWKSIDTTFLDNIPLYNTNIALGTPTFDIIKIENNIENAICEKIEQYRRLNKLGFNRDTILASILSTALANYQIQRITGLTFCQNQFENAIKNYIPAKHTFKAFPIQLNTLDPNSIIQMLKNQPKCRQIMLSSGDSVYFAIRTKLVVYPDNIFALWLSIGVRYFKLV